MRDRETIDSELRRIARGRQSIREQGGKPSSREADELLDELLAHSAGVTHPYPVTPDELEFVPDDWLREPKARAKPRRSKGALRRMALFAALPLSLIAVVTAAVVILAVSRQDSSSQSAEAQPTDAPASAAPPRPAPPPVPVPHVDITDVVFAAALKREGVPVPSQDYVAAQGHAVCDFLSRQPNFEDAVGFLQRSSIWDAGQSTNVTAGAIVSYCPQAQTAATANLQPAYQDALTNLQSIEGKLQGIQGDLQGIQGGLQGLPGHP
jgi:hypothetical protein